MAQSPAVRPAGTGFVAGLETALSRRLEQFVEPRRRRRIARSVEASLARLQTADDAALRQLFQTRQSVYADVDCATQHIGAALEAARRVSGLRVEKQTLAAAVDLVNGGSVVDMSASKRALALTIAAAAVSMTNRVHCLALDDEKSGELFRLAAPVWKFLGIPADLCLPGQSMGTRRTVYSASIVVSAARHIIDDYLRCVETLDILPGSTRRLIDELAGTRSSHSRPLVPALEFALFDNAEILLCEAGPATVSLKVAQQDRTESLLQQVFGLIDQLLHGIDYRIGNRGTLTLTRRGRARLSLISGALGEPWSDLSSSERDNCVCSALSALHVFRRGDDYEIEDGDTIMIHDTVRALLPPDDARVIPAEDFIAFKENIRSQAHEAGTQISFRRFAAKYSGVGALTANRAALAELSDVYGLTHVDRGPVPSPISSRIAVSIDQAALYGAIADDIDRNGNEDRPTIVLAAHERGLDPLAAVLAQRRLRYSRLRGRGSADVTDLFASALLEHPRVVLAGFDPDLLHLSKQVHRKVSPAIILFGIEDFLVAPEALEAAFPVSLSGLPILTCLRADHPIYSDRQSSGFAGANLARWAGLGPLDRRQERVVRNIVNRALTKAIETRKSERAMLYTVQDRQLDVMAFAGDLKRRL